MKDSVVSSPADPVTHENSEANSISTFHDVIGAYAYQPSSGLRRSPRKRTLSSSKFFSNSEERDAGDDNDRVDEGRSPLLLSSEVERDEQDDYSPGSAKLATSSLPRRRVQPDLNDDGGDGKRRQKRKRRGYAAPETYAHLNPVDDVLTDDLDVVFCGINPGIDSARFGLHYAHPSNHFWRCLHLGGFTPKLHPPSDGPFLPALYNIGLTKLVERPSIESGELSREEMSAAVPALLSKIRRYRPRVVCIVGKVAWDAIERVLKHHAPTMPARSYAPQDPSSSLASSSLQPRAVRSSQPPTKSRAAKTAFTWGLQPYTLLHGTGSGTAHLFVVPSTSARVVSHQLPEKVTLFSALKALIDNLHTGTFEDQNILVVDVSVPEQASIEKAAAVKFEKASTRPKAERVGEEESGSSTSPLSSTLTQASSLSKPVPEQPVPE